MSEREKNLEEAAKMFFQHFDKSGQSVMTCWDRVPPQQRVAIVDAFRVAIAKALPQEEGKP